MSYSSPKGLFDILPQEISTEESWKGVHRWQYLEQQLHKIAKIYGFQEIRTPIFEMSNLFFRTSGETSDIVSKEMYQFEDKGNRSLALRPEGTAPIIRAFIEHHLEQLGNFHKLYYIGPFFRYNRPQKGRFRQFHQFGVEVIGGSPPEQDAEIIQMLWMIYQTLGLKNITLCINSIGDSTTRSKYRSLLKQHLQPNYAKLSPEGQISLQKNPLRLLDTKNPNDAALLHNLPSILDFLTPDAKNHFDQVTCLLKMLHIPYTIAPQLVRGLDYYNHTVFEFVTDSLGAQSSIGSGGRYDGLLEFLGGTNLPSTGFALGIERVLQLMELQNCVFPKKSSIFFYLLPLHEESKKFLISILFTLRQKGIQTDMNFKLQKIQKGLQQANRFQAEYCLIVGEEELESDRLQIKKMKNGEITIVSKKRLIEHMQILWESHES